MCKYGPKLLRLRWNNVSKYGPNPPRRLTPQSQTTYRTISLNMVRNPRASADLLNIPRMSSRTNTARRATILAGLATDRTLWPKASGRSPFSVDMLLGKSGSAGWSLRNLAGGRWPAESA